MKAAALILAVLVVIAHPLAAVAVVGAELVVCAALGWRIRRALRFRSCPHLRRTA